MFKKIGKQIERSARDVRNTINTDILAVETAPQLKASEEIRDAVCAKMQQIPEYKANGEVYAELLSLQNAIEAKHDQIYKRPENGVSPTKQLKKPLPHC